jgi:hypothetical protein
MVSVGFATFGLCACWIPWAGPILAWLGLAAGVIGVLTMLFSRVAEPRFKGPLGGIALSLAAWAASLGVSGGYRDVLGYFRTSAGGGKSDVIYVATAEDGGVVSRGVIEVRVQSAILDFVRFQVRGKEVISKDKLLTVNLNISNRGGTKVNYRGWGRLQAGADAATLKDAVGNVCKRVDFGADSQLGGQIDLAPIAQNSAIQDVLVFERPASDDAQLVLELPAGAFFDSGLMRIKIASTSIVRR